MSQDPIQAMLTRPSPKELFDTARELGRDVLKLERIEAEKKAKMDDYNGRIKKVKKAIHEGAAYLKEHGVDVDAINSEGETE